MGTNFYLVPPKMYPVIDERVEKIHIGKSGRMMEAQEIAGHVLHDIDAWRYFTIMLVKEYGWYIKDEYGKNITYDELWEWFDPEKERIDDYSADWYDGSIGFYRHEFS
jgi:hypothetical protein